MAKKKLTPEQEKEIKLLQASNEMLLKTAEEAKLRGNEKSIDRIEIARKDIIAQMAKIDKDIAKDANENKHRDDDAITEMYKDNHSTDYDETVFDSLKKIEAQEVSNEPLRDDYEYGHYDSHTSDEEYDGFSNIDTDVQYDIIELPSNGECYKNKMSRIPVAYLTAYDENLITSPNLYKDGLIIEYLLRNKIVDKSINVNELVKGDVDAIIVWLRATSYGVEFPIKVRDTESGKMVDGVVDLTTIKSKQFNLKGDENGYFDFELPVSKDKVKFKFLTRKDETNLKRLANMENDGAKVTEIKADVKHLKDIVKVEPSLDGKQKQEMVNYLDKFESLAKTISERKNKPYYQVITNRMEMNIVSVNGNSDRKYISRYVKNMGVKDSLAFRRYVLDNEPGMDFSISVDRPESLGGGSINTFLEWDDTVFLNIS